MLLRREKGLTYKYLSLYICVFINIDSYSAFISSVAVIKRVNLILLGCIESGTDGGDTNNRILSFNVFPAWPIKRIVIESPPVVLVC